MAGTPDRFPDPAEIGGAVRSARKRREARARDDDEPVCSADEFDLSALTWDPDSSVDGHGYVASDFRDEVARNLPDGWTVASFEILDPKEKNHGGKPVHRVELVHDSGAATVQVTPVSTTPDHGRRVLNSHRITRTVDGDTETVADGHDMVHRDHPATVFRVAVDAAEAFSDRYNLFHGGEP